MIKKEDLQYLINNIKTITPQVFAHKLSDHGIDLANTVFTMPYKPTKEECPQLHLGRIGNRTTLFCWALVNDRRDLAIIMLEYGVNVNQGPAGLRFSALQFALGNRDFNLATRIVENHSFDISCIGSYALNTTSVLDINIEQRLTFICNTLIDNLAPAQEQSTRDQVSQICRLLFDKLMKAGQKRYLLKIIGSLGASEILDQITTAQRQEFTFDDIKEMFDLATISVQCPAEFYRYLMNEFKFTSGNNSPELIFDADVLIVNQHSNPYNRINTLIKLISNKNLFLPTDPERSSSIEMFYIKNKIAFLLQHGADHIRTIATIINSNVDKLANFIIFEAILVENERPITPVEYALFYLLAKYSIALNAQPSTVLSIFSSSAHQKTKVSDYILRKCVPPAKSNYENPLSNVQRESQLIKRNFGNLYELLMNAHEDYISLKLLIPAIMNMEDLTFLIPYFNKQSQNRTIVDILGLSVPHAPFINSFINRIVELGYRITDRNIYSLIFLKHVGVIENLAILLSEQYTRVKTLCIQAQAYLQNNPDDVNAQHIALGLESLLAIISAKNDEQSISQNITPEPAVILKQLLIMTFTNQEQKFRLAFAQLLQAITHDEILAFEMSLLQDVISHKRLNFVPIIWELGTKSEITRQLIMELDAAEAFSNYHKALTNEEIFMYLTAELQRQAACYKNAAYFLSLFKNDDAENLPLITAFISAINIYSCYTLLKTIIYSGGKYVMAAKNICRGLNNLRVLLENHPDEIIQISPSHQVSRSHVHQLLMTVINPNQEDLETLELSVINIHRNNPNPNLLRCAPALLEAATTFNRDLCAIIIEYDPKAVEAVAIRQCDFSYIHKVNALDVATICYDSRFLLSAKEKIALQEIINLLITKGAKPLSTKGTSASSEILWKFASQLQLGLLASDVQARTVGYDILPRTDSRNFNMLSPNEQAAARSLTLPTSVWDKNILPFIGLPDLNAQSVKTIVHQWERKRLVAAETSANINSSAVAETNGYINKRIKTSSLPGI